MTRSSRIEGVPVPVASPEDLVVMKVLAGRGKDEDVAVLAAQPRLGLDRIREMLEALERALDQRNLRPRFEKLLVRARRPSSR